MVVQLILGFYSRKIFINYLGDEILGLNTTAVNILQFLNLAELGIGTAVGFSLYKPLRARDHETICEIIALQGILYRRIALWMIAGAMIVMAFFPIIFKKIDLPLWYAYASFGVMLFSSLLSYFISYRQVLLSSAQKDYSIQFSYRTWIIVKTVCQMIAVWKLSNPYVWWLILEVVFSLIATLSLNHRIKKTFPYLKPVNKNFQDLKDRYRVIFTKIKQLIFHRISGFALLQSSPLIIYAYLSLTVVTIYGNYLIIVNGIKTTCDTIFGGTAAGIGDLVAENDMKKIMAVFVEMYSTRIFIAAVSVMSFVVLSPSFLQLWIGSTYLLPYGTVLIIAATLFISIFRNAVDLFQNAFGLFQDIWAPIAEAVINILVSIILGRFFGLLGILAGPLAGLVIIVVIWKPFFLFTKGMKVSPSVYFKLFIQHIISVSCAAIIVLILFKWVPLDPNANWMSFSIYSLMFVLGMSFSTGVFLYFTSTGFRTFIKRLYRMTLRK